MNKEEQQGYIIRVVGEKGKFLQITDLQNRYKGKIHKSLIKDNQFEMMDPKFNNIGENCYDVGHRCFEHWLKKDIEAEVERIRTEQFNLFYLNIPLFFKEENRKMILSNSNYYSIVAPEPFFGIMYFSSARSAKVTLGELLQIWKNETDFSVTCSKCGGKSVVYRFGGSPLSGTLFEAKNICIECGNMGNGAGHNFGVLRCARLKYNPIKPIAETPDTIESLVEACKTKWEV